MPSADALKIVAMFQGFAIIVAAFYTVIAAQTTTRSPRRRAPECPVEA